MSIQGYRKAALCDDDASSDTFGTVVQLDHLSTDSEYRHDGTGEEDIAGNEIYAGDDSLLDLGFTDRAGVALLEAWQDAETPLKAALAGLQDNILWGQAATIIVDTPLDFNPGDRNMYRVRMALQGGEHDIWDGINLLQGVSGTEVLFPIEGVTLTLSADGGTGTLEIAAEDKDGTELASDSVAAASRASVSLALPASTYKVQVTLPSGATEAALRTDGKATYTAG